MTALESWRYRDPAKVYERIELMEQAKVKRDERSKRGKGKFGLQQLRELFEEKAEGKANEQE